MLDSGGDNKLHSLAEQENHAVTEFTVLCMQQSMLAHTTFQYQYIPTLVHVHR